MDTIVADTKNLRMIIFGAQKSGKSSFIKCFVTVNRRKFTKVIYISRDAERREDYNYCGCNRKTLNSGQELDDYFKKVSAKREQTLVDGKKPPNTLYIVEDSSQYLNHITCKKYKNVSGLASYSRNLGIQWIFCVHTATTLDTTMRGSATHLVFAGPFNLKKAVDLSNAIGCISSASDYYEEHAKQTKGRYFVISNEYRIQKGQIWSNKRDYRIIEDIPAQFWTKEGN